MDELKTYLSGLGSTEARDDFCRRCGTTWGHVRNCIYEFRPISDELAVAMERESDGVLRVEGLTNHGCWVRHRDPAWPVKAGRPDKNVAALIA
jgi:hypothetical protein